MSARQYVSFAADLAAVLLVIWQLISMRRLPGENTPQRAYFHRLSVVTLIISVLYLLKAYADIQIGGLVPEDFGMLSEADLKAWYAAAVLAWLVDIFLTVVFLFMWITLMCWTLFEDREYLRRRFWVGFMPLIVSAVFTCVCIPLALMSEQGYYVFLVALVVFYIVRTLYFLLSLWLLREYKRQNEYLRFFNPWFFFIPVFAGWVIEDVTGWDFSALGSAIGVVLIYISITRVQRYMDMETEFYNMDFVNFLKGLARKKKYDPHSAMIFMPDSPEERKAFSGILRSQLPKDCEPILCGDGRVVVLTNARHRGPLAMVIEDVQALYEIKADSVLKKKTDSGY